MLRIFKRRKKAELKWYRITFIDEDVSGFDAERFGRQFETDRHFPRKANIEFAEVISPTHLKMRVWERGAAVTLACGTGSCATLVAGVLTGQTDRKAEIELDGGRLFVEWAENNHIFMTGPAELVYEGKLDF